VVSRSWIDLVCSQRGRSDLVSTWQRAGVPTAGLARVNRDLDSAGYGFESESLIDGVRDRVGKVGEKYDVLGRSGRHPCADIRAPPRFCWRFFWITDIFATAHGEDQARITTNQLWSRENSVVLDADARQNLPVPPKQIKVTWVPPPIRSRSRRFFATSVSVRWPFTGSASRLRIDFRQFVGDVEWLACAESSSG
jgi:hypothetical protein